MVLSKGEGYLPDEAIVWLKKFKSTPKGVDVEERGDALSTVIREFVTRAAGERQVNA